MTDEKDDIKGSDEWDDIFDTMHSLFRRRKSKEMKAKNLIGFFGGGGQSSVTTLTTEAQDRFGSHLIFAFEPYLTQVLRQEAETSISLTAVSADNDLVGMIQDTSLGHWIKATSAGSRPKYGLSGGKASIKFDGTNDFMIINNSLGLFKNFWNATPTGSILFKAKVSVDDANTHIFFSSNDGTGGKTGLYLSQTTADKIQIIITKHSPNVSILNYTSSATINVASGEFTVMITLNGVGVGNASIYINNVLDGTGTILAGVSQDASDQFRFGELSATGTSDFNGEIKLLYFTDNVISSADRTWFHAYNPDVDANLFPLIEHTRYDFSDATKMYTETSSPATNVSANDDPIGTIKNGITYPSTIDLKRDATAPSDAKRPLYKTNVKNSLSAGYWDGEVTFQELNHGVWPRGGCYTHVIIEKFLNESAPLNEGRKVRSDGSPGLTNGTNYMTQTGSHGDASSSSALSNYGTSAGQGYFIQHIGGSPPGVAVADVGDLPVGSPGNEAYNIAVFIYVGSTCYAYNHAGLVKTFTITGAASFTKIGGIAGTWANNHICEDRLYVGIPGGTVSRLTTGVSTLISTLKTKWGIS